MIMGEGLVFPLAANRVVLDGTGDLGLDSIAVIDSVTGKGQLNPGWKKFASEGFKWWFSTKAAIADRVVERNLKRFSPSNFDPQNAIAATAAGYAYFKEEAAKRLPNLHTLPRATQLCYAYSLFNAGIASSRSIFKNRSCEKQCPAGSYPYSYKAYSKRRLDQFFNALVRSSTYAYTKALCGNVDLVHPVFCAP